ncbi:stage II sporulation protein AB (anti-sigma F factor) [Desulfohalotomaculum tongense]|uniref:anti-sigma F factor n=1 Tax=Desulforadius tongensis TaxID=1216062 RepID=UPI001958F3F1|nr:anti-sigma F factor [Desulforadius tongensis]MBM7854694.1 stage II sporulation protein AB (anti-sigma F factor) [Desulforadius tongensis]
MKLINQFKLQFKSIAENVAFARVTVAAFASQLDYTLNDLEEIKVALSEAITNAIVHGYENDHQQIIELTVSLTDAGMEIRVEDKGKGIEDIARAMEPTYSTDPERMGLGFVFMQSFMDEFQVDSAPGKGTTVVMFKKVNSAAANPEH